MLCFLRSSVLSIVSIFLLKDKPLVYHIFEHVYTYIYLLYFFSDLNLSLTSNYIKYNILYYIDR